MPLPDGQTTWATIANVVTYTGVTVTADELARTQAVIDVHAGRTVDQADAIGDKDLYWLKLATAYQAAWQKAQPDMFVRLDFKEVVQEAGSSAPIADAGLTLGPLARRALRRLSWQRSRSLELTPPGGPLSGSADFTNEMSDDHHAWRAL